MKDDISAIVAGAANPKCADSVQEDAQEFVAYQCGRT
jgi:hypothetical protein